MSAKRLFQIWRRWQAKEGPERPRSRVDKPEWEGKCSQNSKLDGKVGPGNAGEGGRGRKPRCL